MKSQRSLSAFEVLKFGRHGQTGMSPVWPLVPMQVQQEEAVMSANNCPRLTPRDFAILETMLAGHEGSELLTAAMRKKLDVAQIVFADDLPSDVVSIGSRVAFTIDDGWPLVRRLVAAEQYVPGQDHQTLESLRGVALLGHVPGDRLEVNCGARTEVLEVQKVLYQPEAENRPRKSTDRVRLVSSSDKPKPQSPFVTSGDDDPGPSAA